VTRLTRTALLLPVLLLTLGIAALLYSAGRGGEGGA
jgi:hypothetical protein